MDDGFIGQLSSWFSEPGFSEKHCFKKGGVEQWLKTPKIDFRGHTHSNLHEHIQNVFMLIFAQEAVGLVDHMKKMDLSMMEGCWNKSML